MNLVSIIIPFKNPGKYFKPCLESIRNQSYQNIEVLMIDDHSNYNDAEVARMAQIKDKRFQLYRSNGPGIINALQTGLNLAKGEFISRMDADDLMTKDKIELMRSALLKSNQKSVCTALVSYFASEKSIQEGFIKYENWLNKLTTEESNFTQIYKECTIPSPCWMARKLDIENIGGFKCLTYPEDYDLAFKMYYSKLKIISVKKVLHHWRDHPNRISRTSETYKMENFTPLKLKYLLDYEIKHEHVILWGAGKKAKRIAKQLLEKKVHFDWITENTNKIGKSIYGKLVQDLSRLKDENQKVIICAISQIGFETPRNSNFNRFISFY